MKHIKRYESFETSDITSDLLNYLKSNNYSPLQINKIIDSYSGLIEELSQKGENNKLILKRIIELLPEVNDDDFLQVKLPNSSWRNVTYL